MKRSTLLKSILTCGFAIATLTKASPGHASPVSAQTYAEMYSAINFNRPTTKTNAYRYYDFDNGQLSRGLIEFSIIAESAHGEKADIDSDFGAFADANAPGTDPTHFVGKLFCLHLSRTVFDLMSASSIPPWV